jgi:predicted glutamine amidotransferase
MCRIFSYSGDVSGEDFSAAVTEFAKLARDGNVPQGIEPGHVDGWGVRALAGDTEVYERSQHEATAEDLLAALRPLRGVGQVVIHLRKATVGENKIANTHPFLRDGISFCHNGSIQRFPEGTVSAVEGDTDSEKYFVRVLARLARSSLAEIARGIEEEIHEIQKAGDWTSLTCLAQSREGMVLKYFWNEAHPMTEAGRLNDYYTFFRGTKNEGTMLCSEMLTVPGFTWQPLLNGTLVVLRYE